MAVIISRRFSYCPNFATTPVQVRPWTLLLREEKKTPATDGTHVVTERPGP